MNSDQPALNAAPDHAAVADAVSAAAALWNEQWAVQRQADLSARYHRKRERWFALCERWLQALAALLATSAFAQLAGAGDGSRWLALVAAGCSVFSLVFGVAERARVHGQLATEYRRLLADLRGAGLRLAEAQVVQLKARLAGLEVSEPDPMNALVMDCENEIAIAAGDRGNVVPLSLWERLWMQVWSFELEPIYARHARREARRVGSVA